MPRFRVRLNQPGSEEFRISYVSFDTADQARAWAERREQEFVEFRVTKPNPKFTGPEGDEPADIPVTKEELAEAPKNQRILHEQTEPYEVAYVEERGPIVPEQKRHLKGKGK